MSYTSLPPEIKAHARQFGFVPQVSNEDIYNLIQELDPYYSIVELARRVSMWHNEWKRSNRQLTIEEPFTYTSVEKIWNKHLSGADLPPSEIQTYYLRDAYPLNPAVIHSYNDDYYFIYDDPIPNFYYQDPFNEDALTVIKTIEPKFSLQKEYDRIQTLYNYKKKSHVLDRDISKLINIKRVTMIDDMIGIVAEDKREPLDLLTDEMYYPNDVGQTYLYDATVSLDDYLHLVAKLWNGISYSGVDYSNVYDYYSIYPTSFTTSLM